MTFDTATIISVLGGVIVLINGWLILIVKGFSADILALRAADNAFLVSITATGVKGEALAEILRESRAEQRELSRTLSQLAILVAEVKVISVDAVVQAKAAFLEANTVNRKIERIGLAVVNGTKLNENER